MADIPEIDLSKLKYPSDQLTLGKLRELDPKLFATADVEGIGTNALESNFLDLLWYERGLVVDWYDKKTGRPPAETWDSTEEKFESLCEIYEKYGISSGPESSKQILRDLETQVDRLAAKALGRTI